MSAVSDLPLVDEYLASELYGPSGDPEVEQMQRELWQSIRGDVLGDLDAAAAAPADEIRAVLHRIAGYVSTSGFKRLGAHLKAWESATDPTAESASALVLAREWATGTIVEIEKRFSHLAKAP